MKKNYIKLNWQKTLDNVDRVDMCQGCQGFSFIIIHTKIGYVKGVRDVRVKPLLIVKN